jgi:2-polyprenyl-3-methyl-5-hydroxy-6-metoxy-1,4-benzoquinol methylase
MNEIEVRRYLNVIKRAVSIIEGMLDNDDSGLLEKLATVEKALPAPVVAQLPVAEIKEVANELPKIEPMSSDELKKIQLARSKHIGDLMAIDCWPEAASPCLVASATTEDQINRACSVLDMIIDRSLDNLHFLDFGCGDGWVANEAKKLGVASTTGYDIKLSNNWGNLKDANFTHIYNELKRGFYDVVFLYDVLDHCENPLQLMSQVKNVLKPDGVVYIRCHPWTAKHASHAFKQGLNKAYIHLFLKPEEIVEIIKEPVVFTRIEKDPLVAYHWWFNEFDVKKETLIKEPVSEFFFVPAFKELLAIEQQIPLDQIDNFLKLLEIQLVDYKLTHKK